MKYFTFCLSVENKFVLSKFQTFLGKYVKIIECSHKCENC